MKFISFLLIAVVATASAAEASALEATTEVAAAANEGMTEIIVQFVTPPSVVLRLDAQPRGRMVFGGSPDFDAYAKYAHSAFREQLGRLPMPRGAQQPEILSEHHTLFNGVVMRVPTSMTEAIARLPEVLAVSPNEIFVPFAPANPLLLAEARQLFDLDYIHNELELPEQSEQTGLTGRNVRVAVIDTGIDHAHPEFERFLADGKVPGYDFYEQLNPTHHHGTLVAGALAAIAPDIKLYSYRIAMQNFTTGGSALDAIERAHADKVRVINMSFGAVDSANSPIGIAAANAVRDGIVVVAAAGNSGPGASTIASPASQPLVIAVGAGTAGGRSYAALGDTVWQRSSRGPARFTDRPKPDILAPGVGIFTATIGGYTITDGTSLAAPIIAGVAALILEAHPHLTPPEVMERLKITARPLAVEAANNIYASGSGFVRPLEAIILAPGDVNGDGAADTLDIYALRQYLAGLRHDIVELNADLNGDGEINITDLTALRLRLAETGTRFNP